MQPIQFIAIIFALFALSRVILRLKDKKLTKTEFIFWFLIWIALIVIAFFPEVVVFFGDLSGFRRGMDLLIFLSVGLLFYLVFRMYVKIDEQDQEITKLVRELAMKEASKKESRKGKNKK
jgi:small membrane protein